MRQDVRLARAVPQRFEYPQGLLKHHPRLVETSAHPGGQRLGGEDIAAALRRANPPADQHGLLEDGKQQVIDGIN